MKKEDFYNTKWDQSEWTTEMKTQWQEKCFELGFYWFIDRGTIKFLEEDYFYLESDGTLTYSDSDLFENTDTEEEVKTWEDMFPEDNQTLDYIRELKPFEVKLGMKVKVVGRWGVKEDSVEEVTGIYGEDDSGFDLSCGATIGGDNFSSGKVKVYLVEDVAEVVEETFEKTKSNPKYDRKIYGKYNTGSCTVDVYDVLDAFDVTSPQLQHAAKKILACGLRGHKDTREDLVDILHSVESAIAAFDTRNK